MKKCSKLLIFAFLISHAFMKDCSSEATCAGTKENGNDDDYKCYAKDEESDCTWTLLCSKVPKSTTGMMGRRARNLQVIDCSSHPVSESTQYKCVEEADVSAPNACKEVKYSCNEVPKPNDDTQVTCSDFDAEDTSINGCVAKTGDDDKACEEKKFCGLVELTADTTETECPKYPTQSKSKGCVKATENTSGNTCKEVYLCSKVTREDYQKDKTITCSSLIVSDSSKFYCDDADESDETNLCKEVKYCEEVTNDDTDKECTDKKTKDPNKICIENTGTTKAEQPCQELELCTDGKENADGANCQDYPVAKEDRETKGCFLKDDSTNCGPKDLCALVEISADTIDCSNYPVSWEKRKTHKCVALTSTDPNNNKACEEKENTFCLDTNADPQKCNDYPIKDDDGTKKCVKNGAAAAATPCTTETLKCAEKTTGATNAICAKLTLVDQNKECKLNGDACEEKEKETPTCLTETDVSKCNTYTFSDVTKKCVENTNKAEGQTTCIEQIKNCNEITSGATEDICKKLTVVGENKECKLNGNACEEKDKTCLTEKDTSKCSSYILSDVTKECVENTAENPETKCIERIKNCKEIVKGATNNICGKLTLEDKTKACRSNGEACVEIEKTVAEINCTEGKDNSACTYYKVSDITTKKCVKNTDTTEGASTCIEETLSCEELTTDATDEICKKLTLKNDEETVCKKDSKENKCVVITYCEHGNGASDDECGKFAVKDTNKECKKKKNEDVCEEVTKAQRNNGNGSLIRVSISLLLLFAILI